MYMSSYVRQLSVSMPITVWLLLLQTALGTDYRVDDAQVEGTKCTFAVPKSWNGKLLIYAHGARMPDSPLSARLNTEALAFRSLLTEGWIVAATSYRRNGIIIRDGINDIHSLRSM